MIFKHGSNPFFLSNDKKSQGGKNHHETYRIGGKIPVQEVVGETSKQKGQSDGTREQEEGGFVRLPVSCERDFAGDEGTHQIDVGQHGKGHGQSQEFAQQKHHAAHGFTQDRESGSGSNFTCYRRRGTDDSAKKPH